MAEIDIELDNDMIEGIKRLAMRHYGDSSDASVGRVAESAAEMHLLWSHLVKGSEKEIDEPIYYVKGSERSPLWNTFWKNI